MSAAIARQWERIEYQAPIQLRVFEGADNTRTLHARAVNVSEGGIQVRTDHPLPIGEAVTCSMLLEGRPAALSGHVRWARATAPGFTQPGAGIQFDGLSDGNMELLRHLVSRADRGDQPVELFLPGMTQAVHARAFTSDGGLHITAALPVLTRDAPIEFQFHDEGPRFRGRIARVAVRERGRTPHLEVELAVHAREAPRFRHYTMYEAKAENDDPRLAPPAEAPRPPRAKIATPLPDLPKSLSARMPRAALLGVVGLGAALVVLLMAWIVAAPSTLALRPEPNPKPMAEPAVAAVEVAIPAVEAPEVVAPKAPSPPAQLGAAAAIAVPSRTPTVRAVDGATEIHVPISGTLEGMRITRWASPVAVVIDLPNATLGAASGTYFPQTGHVDRLSLVQGESTTRVRAFLDSVPIQHQALLRDGQLVIRIEHDHRGQATAIAL